MYTNIVLVMWLLVLQLIGQLKSLDKKLEPKLKEALEVVSGKTTVSPSAMNQSADEELEKQPRKRKRSLVCKLHVCNCIVGDLPKGTFSANLSVISCGENLTGENLTGKNYCPHVCLLSVD